MAIVGRDITADATTPKHICLTFSLPIAKGAVPYFIPTWVDCQALYTTKSFESILLSFQSNTLSILEKTANLD